MSPLPLQVAAAIGQFALSWVSRVFLASAPAALSTRPAVSKSSSRIAASNKRWKASTSGRDSSADEVPAGTCSTAAWSRSAFMAQASIT